jgi:L-lysine exporter family protein LysE/ArgO
VLRQGIRREHVLPVIAFCIVSDVLLIGAAVVGVGVALDRWPALVPVARWAGGLFVIGYGLTAAWRAWRGGGRLEVGSGGPVSARRALLTVAALTWLNPHLYVDIMMLGTVTNGHGAVGRWWFYAGLIVASVTWFAGLGDAAGRPSRWFTRPRAWRLLGAGVAVAMVSLGTGLILTA